MLEISDKYDIRHAHLRLLYYFTVSWFELIFTEPGTVRNPSANNHYL